MATLEAVDQLLDDVDPESEIIQNDGGFFTDVKTPKSVVDKIWSYLFNENPFEDGMVLTCTAFRDITYGHPSHSARYHFRLEPDFKFHNNDANIHGFQIGCNISPAARRAVLVKSIADAVLNQTKLTFPFHNLKVYNVVNTCKLKDVIPLFATFKKNIKFMSWNCCRFLNEDFAEYKASIESDEKEDVADSSDDIIDCFPSCNLFTLVAHRRWHKSISLNGKFPNLLSFSCTVEWYSYFDLLQQFLDSHAESLRILYLDFTFKIQPQDLQRWSTEARMSANPTRLKLKLPANVEICVLSCLFPQTAEFIDIDFSECRHNLKQLNCLKNSLRFANPMFLDGAGNKKLQYLVVNDMDGVHQIKWNALKIGTGEMNLLKNVYAPCTPQFADKISDNCIGQFPGLEEVKEVLESVKARQHLRELNCQERRHFLWGMFWHGQDGIGKKNLKALEMNWKRQESTYLWQ